VQGTKADPVQFTDYFVITLYRFHILHANSRNTGAVHIFYYHLPFQRSIDCLDFHIAERISSWEFQFRRKYIDMDKFFLNPATTDPSIIICGILCHFFCDLTEFQSEKRRCILRTSYGIQFQSHIAYLMISEIQADFIPFCKMTGRKILNLISLMDFRKNLFCFYNIYYSNRTYHCLDKFWRTCLCFFYKFIIGYSNHI